jgi:hypothetical protein
MLSSNVSPGLRDGFNTLPSARLAPDWCDPRRSSFNVCQTHELCNRWTQTDRGKSFLTLAGSSSGKSLLITLVSSFQTTCEHQMNTGQDEQSYQK